jgi:hypothetical protein
MKQKSQMLWVFLAGAILLLLDAGLTWLLRTVWHR